MSQQFTLPAGAPRERRIQVISQFLGGLDGGRGWLVEVRAWKRTRSSQQNRYLWGCVYPHIMKHLDGWEAEDVHEYFLGEHFGWETLTGLGRRRLRPLRRSSKLTTVEFNDYVAFIQRKAAELGIYIPDPNEFEQAAA